MGFECGTGGEAEPAQGLNAPQITVMGEDPQGGGGRIDTDRVERAAALADPRAQIRGARRGLCQRHAGTDEEPGGDDGIPRPDAGQHGGNGGPLRREARRQEREPEESAHGAYTGSI